MKHRPKKTQAIVLALSVPSVLLALGGTPNYEITRSTTSGGSTAATGGGYELSGTYEPGDGAGPTAGGYTLTGGFNAEQPPGDCDADSIAGLVDYSVFAACVTGPGTLLPDGCQCYDVDRSGAVDLADYAATQAAFNAMQP